MKAHFLHFLRCIWTIKPSPRVMILVKSQHKTSLQEHLWTDIKVKFDDEESPPPPCNLEYFGFKFRRSGDSSVLVDLLTEVSPTVQVFSRKWVMYCSTDNSSLSCPLGFISPFLVLFLFCFLLFIPPLVCCNKLWLVLKQNRVGSKSWWEFGKGEVMRQKRIRSKNWWEFGKRAVIRQKRIGNKSW